MWRQRLELWARDVVEQVQGGAPPEDALVELKREWPPPDKASRRIAAHANAARGEEILWVIGIDERTGKIHEVDHMELANWWPQVQRNFDEEVVPHMRHLFISTPEGRIAALAFDTDRGPYVVKVSHDPVTREVPWRDGTRTRTARRSELLKALVPAVTAPAAHVIALRAVAEHRRARDANSTYAVPAEEEHIAIRLHGNIYLDPPAGGPIVLPDHAMTGELDWNPRRTRQTAPPETPISPSLGNKVFFTAGGSRRVEAHPLGIEHRHGSVYVNGAGEMELSAHGVVDVKFIKDVRRTRLIRVHFRLAIAGEYATIRADCRLERSSWPADMGRDKPRPEDLGVWTLSKDDA